MVLAAKSRHAGTFSPQMPPLFFEELHQIARQFSVDVSQLIFIGDKEKNMQTA